MFRATPSASARTALGYITFGSLLVIWTVVWYWYMIGNKPTTNSPYYFCGGLLLTGIVFICIGFGTGRIGYAAKQADNPVEAIVTTPPALTTPSQPVEMVVSDPKKVPATNAPPKPMPKENREVVTSHPV